MLAARITLPISPFHQRLACRNRSQQAPSPMIEIVVDIHPLTNDQTGVHCSGASTRSQERKGIPRAMAPTPLCEIAIRPSQVREHRRLLARNLRPKPSRFQAPRRAPRKLAQEPRTPPHESSGPMDPG
jgi:hypothetical protein